MLAMRIKWCRCRADNKNGFVKRLCCGNTELVVSDMIRRATFAMHSDITAYMVEQLSPGHMKIQLEPLLSELDHPGFEQLWEAKGIVAPEITVEAYDFTPSATKMRRITKRF